MTANTQPVLEDDTFLLRPLTGSDRDGLTEAAADPLIWAGHPATTRYLPEGFGPYFEFLLKAGGTLVFTEKPTGRIFGCSRYYVAPPDEAALSIGFTFLTRDHWGGATNRAIKALMLAHAFAHADRVWFHIGPSNLRSQMATAKLGARHIEDAEIDLGTGPAMWKCFRLTEADWLSR